MSQFRLMQWMAHAARCMAACDQAIDLLIDRETKDKSMRVMLSHRGVEFCSAPINAEVAANVAAAIIAAVNAALEIRAEVGRDGEPITMNIMQAENLGRFDPLAAAFIAAYDDAREESEASE